MSRGEDKQLARDSATERWFQTTQWSIVTAASDPAAEGSVAAMEQLCTTYWYPLYAFVRRQGHSPEEASDLTQEFVSRLLAGDCLRDLDPKKGRFRSFLIGCLKRFLADEWDKSRAKKRGGGRRAMSLDTMDLETRSRVEPVDTASADRLYERRWALTVLEVVLRKLETECNGAGKGRLFAALEPGLAGGNMSKPLAEVAAELGMTEGAVKTASHRLKQRFVELLRAEVAQTVADPQDVDDELRHLIAVVAR